MGDFEFGKIPNDVLKSIVLFTLKNRKNNLVVRPESGEDACAIDHNNELLVMSSQPVSIAHSEAGRVAIYSACNNLAACGTEAYGVMLTILAPKDFTKLSLERVMKQLVKSAQFVNVDILGGHTEISKAVNSLVINVTAIGWTSKEKLIKTSGCKIDDDIVLTKSAGLEGTAILAFENENEISKKYGAYFVTSSKKLLNEISVVKEGKIAFGFGVNAMHDASQHGVLGAIWDIVNNSGHGVIIDKELIPVEPETKTICDFYSLNPYTIPAGGSMLISCTNGDKLVEELNKHSIKASVIGKVTIDKKKILRTESGEIIIPPPTLNELTKVRG